MTATSPTKDQLAPHVDHDVSQFLLLHRELDSLRYRIYPEVVRRAIVVAYAAHFRALIEFFHDGNRPSQAEMDAVGCERRTDITFSSFAGSTRPAWTDSEKMRLCDANKLVGHLSQARVSREGAYPRWGAAADLDLLRGHIRALLAAVARPLLARSHLSSSVL
jgi:hypothetical protein